MARKGHPSIYLLAAVFAVACLSGCIQWEYQRWSGPIPLNTITWQSDYDRKTGEFTYHFDLEILSIQRVGDAKVIYPPPGERKTLWLQPGEYIAKIKCDRAPGAQDDAELRKSGTPLGEDQMYRFALVIKKQGSGQVLECAVDDTGKVFVGMLETIEVVG